MYYSKGIPKGKLNDSEMTLGNRKIEKTELSFNLTERGHQELMQEKVAVDAVVIKLIINKKY